MIDRAVLANYLETPYTWNLIANEAQVNDFRPVKRFRIDGGTGLLGTIQGSDGPNPGALTPITQGAQYPEDFLTDDQYTYQLLKYGKRMPFFWETFVNDDLNALKDTPARFRKAAVRAVSEEYFVITKLFANNVSGNGPNGNPFYSNGNKNIVNIANSSSNFTKDNPPLTITALQQAMVVMMQQLDTTGQPISVEAMTLVVPPSLKTIANEHPEHRLRVHGGSRRYSANQRDQRLGHRCTAVARYELGQEHRAVGGQLLPADLRHHPRSNRVVSVQQPGKRSACSGVWPASRSHPDPSYS